MHSAATLSDMAANPEQNPSDRTSLRDAGLRRIRNARRWLAGGAVVLTGAFAGVAGTTTHNSSSTATQPPAASQSDDGGGSIGTTNGTTSTNGSDSSGGAQLQAPSQAPQQAPSTAQPQSSSGAS